jgi:Xaa-Pro aminopeptidase
MRGNGAEGLAFKVIAVSGTASSLPHGNPRDVKLEKGFFTMDFGCIVNGYHSDMTRTVCIGKAGDEVKKVYDVCLGAQLRALEVVGYGVKCSDADKAARDYMAGYGYADYFGHSLGHGVGLQIHESPRLASTSPDVLTYGNVTSVEPGIYLEGKYGVRIEDLIVITENGVVNLTKSPKDLIEIC